MKAYPISIASYSFHGALAEGVCNVFSYLEALKYRYHVDYADIWSGFLPTLDESFIKGVRRAMDERDITLANLCVDGPCLWMDDPDERAAHKAKMLEYIAAARLLGARTVRIDFGGADGVEMSDEAFGYIVDTYREYCGICGEFGAKIGPENHWGWDRVPENLAKVRDAVAMPNYGHLFHFGNFWNNMTEQGTAVAVSYAMHTHISADYAADSGKYIALLAQNGYEGTYSVEHHTGEHEFERVEAQLGQVRNAIATMCAK